MRLLGKLTVALAAFGLVASQVAPAAAAPLRIAPDIAAPAITRIASGSNDHSGDAPRRYDNCRYSNCRVYDGRPAWRDGRWGGKRWGDGDWRGGRYIDRDWDRPVIRHKVRPRYLHGHRGYSKYRPGYRRHNDGWFYPPAAFIIGGIIVDSVRRANRSHALPARHYAWCDRRYKSYRAWDDTFQPYHGPRRTCNSPFDGR